MSFRVHRAERADLLVDGLAGLLREPPVSPPDPFAQELVLVPAKGIERWLSQRLSHRLGQAAGRDDGVCAGVEFGSPWSLIAEVLGTRDDDPWSPEHLAWPLLRVIDASAGEPWARVLSDHLGHGVGGEEGELRRGRRYAVARRLAGLLAAYAAQRPALLEDWAAGRSEDGHGEPLPVDLQWQPELWRRLLGEVAAPSPIERHRATVAALERAAIGALPPRLSLFGHTRLSLTEAELLAALGRHRDVHLWLPHPSDTLWAGLAGQGQVRRRRDDDSHARIDNPLLAAMSRDVRELQGVLERVGVTDDGAAPTPRGGDSLLETVQADVAAARAPGRTHPGDTSVQVHACHGPARQVEVLREVLLGLLQDDPSLEPRDVVVMCPDIEAYAPLLTAAFGLGEAVRGSHPSHQLRVQLADRAPAQLNPLLGVLIKVLDLADGRAEATRVLDLLSLPPVARAFGFSDNDLEIVGTWVADAGVRWAWEESDREIFGLGAIVQNTWRFGLDRVLTGVALSEDSQRYVGRALPLDDVASTAIGLAGRFAEAIDRLRHLTSRCRGERPAEQWRELLVEGLEMLAAVPPGEEWQFAQVQRELARLTDGAGGTGLRLSDVRSLLHGQLGSRPGRANFRNGTLTVCTLTPMRSVPHRVVCLLGLDDRIFPRGGHPDGDDVLARSPLVGERDLRAQDRQLFLDAVMAAGERLVITYTGFAESTGQPRPPSVPLREFIDTVRATAPDYGCVRAHRSQSFHPEYLTEAVPFSFDPTAPSAARVSLGEREPAPSMLDLRLDPSDEEVIELRDLAEALVTPAKAFLRHRLGIALPREDDEILDALPVSLTGLEEWAVGERLLRAVLAGREIGEVKAMEWRRGTLPPAQLGVAVLKRISDNARPLVEEFEATTQGVAARHLDVDVALPDGRRIVGTVPGVHGTRIARVGYSRLSGKQRVETWLHHAVLAAAHPTVPWVSKAIGRGEEPGHLAAVVNNPIDDALGDLVGLVQLRDLALHRPVPLGIKTSWLQVAFRGSTWDRDQEIRKTWAQERKSAEMRVLFAHPPAWADVASLTHEGQPLLDDVARRLWQPIRAVARR